LSKNSEKAAKEQRGGSLLFRPPMRRSPGFLRRTRNRSLIISWKNSENSDTLVAPRAAAAGCKHRSSLDGAAGGYRTYDLSLTKEASAIK
jgi:hypothetical protein